MSRKPVRPPASQPCELTACSCLCPAAAGTLRPSPYSLSSPPCPHTLTSWQKCPMPRILKEPVGCMFSHLRRTVVPATWDSAQLSSSGVTVWKCSGIARSAREPCIPAATQRACGRTRVSQPRQPQDRGGSGAEAPQPGSLGPSRLPACETPGKCLLLSGPQFPHVNKAEWTRGPSFCNCVCPQCWGWRT